MWLHVVALVVAAGVFACCCHSLSILIYLNWSNFAKKRHAADCKAIIIPFPVHFMLGEGITW
jgi:hypothetical protein